MTKKKLYELKRGEMFFTGDKTYWFIKCDGMYGHITDDPEVLDPDYNWENTKYEEKVGYLSCSYIVNVRDEE